MERQELLREIKGKLEDIVGLFNQLIILDMPKERKGEVVITVILDYAGITMEQLIESKKEKLTFYKRILSYLLRDYCDWTFVKIAETVSVISHATIKHHVDKMRWWMANPQYAPADIITATRNILKELGYEK